MPIDPYHHWFMYYPSNFCRIYLRCVQSTKLYSRQ